jgi:predicted RNase H-like nuclease (RuvC/YqgF family)
MAVKKLADKGDASALNTLADSEPNSVRGDNARALLKYHSKQTKQIKKLKSTNKNLKKENTQLKENLDKLNRINLEMEKRSP